MDISALPFNIERIPKPDLLADLVNNLPGYYRRCLSADNFMTVEEASEIIGNLKGQPAIFKFAPFGEVSLTLDISGNTFDPTTYNQGAKGTGYPARDVVDTLRGRLGIDFRAVQAGVEKVVRIKDNDVYRFADGAQQVVTRGPDGSMIKSIRVYPDGRREQTWPIPAK